MGCEIFDAVVVVAGLGGGGKEGGGGGEITLSEYGLGLGGGRRFFVSFGWLLDELIFSADEVDEPSVSNLELLT